MKKWKVSLQCPEWAQKKNLTLETISDTPLDVTHINTVPDEYLPITTPISFQFTNETKYSPQSPSNSIHQRYRYVPIKSSTPLNSSIPNTSLPAPEFSTIPPNSSLNIKMLTTTIKEENNSADNTWNHQSMSWPTYIRDPELEHLRLIGKIYSNSSEFYSKSTKTIISFSIQQQKKEDFSAI